MGGHRSYPSTTCKFLTILFLLTSIDTVDMEGCSCNTSVSPSDFLNLKQYKAYLVIQSFKLSITCDPTNATLTWVGKFPCNYTGFYCDSPPNSPLTPTIASIDFNGFHLCAPTLSGFLDQLPDLALFHANSNFFSGTVPNLTALPFLAELDLSNNLLSGPFPAPPLPLAQLIFLDLRFNSFSGDVPPTAFTAGADVLFINNNRFSQPLPEDLGSSPALYISLANNDFTGPIPTSISNASATLKEILFLNNSLCDCLPHDVGLLHEATVFDAGMNRITGPIPHSFGCLSKVEQLNLADNLLYGEVPDVVCRLATKTGKLENLSLSGNYFTSLGHSCWGLVKSGVLDVKNNCILGLKDQRPTIECWDFWLQPKYCPYLLHIPCKLPTWWSNWVPARWSSSSSSPSPSPPARKYMTYSALNHRHGR